MAITVPLICTGMDIRTVVQARLAAALLVVNGRRHPQSPVTTDSSTI